VNIVIYSAANDDIKEAFCRIIRYRQQSHYDTKWPLRKYSSDIYNYLLSKDCLKVGKRIVNSNSKRVRSHTLIKSKENPASISVLVSYNSFMKYTVNQHYSEWGSRGRKFESCHPDVENTGFPSNRLTRIFLFSWFF